MLTTEALLDTAVSATGLDDFGDGDWREGLDRLTDALSPPRRTSTPPDTASPSGGSASASPTVCA
ncbi:MAG: hypothetical protein IPK07_19760 [Deltaproteobacteria bacterium]|nr:hypothetical protein [Deltaproteobacteria bacterium]